MRLRRFIACAFLCLGLCLPVAAYAQDEIGATGNTAAPDAPAADQPAAKPKLPKDLPPSVEDVPLPPAAPPGSMQDMPVAEVQALDKITARVTHIEIKTGDIAVFGSLSIQVKACRKSAPEDAPESAAFLVISEQKAGEDAAIVYSGWMFASSPALAAMDNPIYDIWLTECRAEALPMEMSPAIGAGPK